MRSLNLVASICIALAVALFAPQVSLGQYTISTIAGGGPNNLPALPVLLTMLSASASLGYPESVAFDSAGNAYIANSYFYANQIIEVSSAGIVTVVAGNGTFGGYSGDGGPATSAALNQPQGVFVDGSGNIFIADSQNSLIREVVASTGVIQTVAGNFIAGPGYSGDGGPATQAQLDTPASVFVDSSGNIFITDTDNSIIREVVETTGFIQTVAGTPQQFGFSGDGGSPTAAVLDIPTGVFLDSSGNIFISDTFNNVIRVVNTGTQPITIAGTTVPAGAGGVIQTVVGPQYTYELGACAAQLPTETPLTANLCYPTGIFVDSSEDIYIADNNNFAIREATNAGTTGTITTVAGTIGSNCATYLSTGCGNGSSATASTAQLNYPNGVYVDSAGDIYIADSEDFVVREVTASNSQIQAYAGNGFQAYSGDGGSPTNAELNDPGAVFVDASGNVFIADTSNSVIREIVASTGDITTVAGNGVPGYSGDGVSPTTTELNFPGGVFVDAQGDIFIADTANSAIREVVAATGLIQTVAGTPGTAGYSGDGDPPPTIVELAYPNAVLVDGSGNIYIADTTNSAIRVVNTGSSKITVAGVTIPAGEIQTVAGTPTNTCDDDPNPKCGDGGPATSAYLSFPSGIFLDAAGDIFIADTSDNAIREVSATSGTIQTVAGTIGAPGGFSGDGSAAISALLDSPSGVFLDASNDIFIADSENAAIREVVAATGFIQTVAGIPATAGGFPTPGFSGDGGPATSAELDAPSGVFVTSAGKLFIADTDNSRIRELAPAPFTVTVAPSTATVVVNALQQYTATVTGNPNTSVNWFVNQVAGGNSTVGTISTTGLFTAPAVVPSSPTVTISAVSQVDNTTSGSAQATIANPSATGTVTVSTSPPVTQVYTSTMQDFLATVTGTTSSAVTWYVEGSQGGNATFGTIDSSGNYTAPANVPSPATITIEAVSQADPTAIGTESVTIVAAPAAAQPAAQTVSPGGTATYSLTLTGGSPSQPITLSCLQISLPSGATCVFSQNGTTITKITPSSNGVPFTVAVTVPSTSAFLHKPGQLGLAPIYAAFIPLAGFLLLGGKPRNRQRRWGWLVLLCVFLAALVASGGGGSSTSTGPVTYAIKIQGTTAAQPNPVTITTATLIVQ